MRYRSPWFFLSMCRRLTIPGLLALLLIVQLRQVAAQTEPPIPGFQDPSRFRLAVNEVSLTFHAADALRPAGR